MEKKKYIMLLALLVLLIALAAIIYPKLSDSYTFEGQTDNAKAIEATDFTVYDTDGNKASLSEQKGKPVIVNFWATWCKYCMNELPAFNSMYDKYKNEVTFMMVDLTDGSRETKEASLAFIKEQGYTFPVYLDNDQSAYTAYSITSIPSTLFIDEDGTLLFTQTGAMDEDTLENNIKALLNGSTEQAATPQKKSKCSFH